ncbi:adenylate/guanylate cyclase domain-containing protein [Aliisedimentitalea scapharcae]|uniref:Adenylate/guanylate cyclase domain-containing protein n=1 Tax=Aliisedimentitalea scapharcae TaxID=1524259 RepID=A0ABZ2XPI6_9RHOB
MRKRITRFPITFSLFAVILGVALVLAVPLAIYSHVTHKNSTMITASEIMERSADILRLKIDDLIKPAEAVAQVLAIWPNVGHLPHEEGHSAELFLSRQLTRLPYLASINIGFDDGSFYLIGLAASRPPERLVELAAPEGTVFLTQSIFRNASGHRVSVRRFLDHQGELLAASQTLDPEYDPRVRPWFKSATDDKSVSRTKLYKFTGTGLPGLTISRRHPGGTVGVDVTLAQIEEFLGSEPQAESGLLTIFGSDGTVLASTAHDAEDELVQTDLIMRIQQEPGFRAGLIDAQGDPWVAHVVKASSRFEADEILALAMPVSTIAAPVNRVTRNTFLVSALILLSSIPIVWLVSRGLSRPLIGLATDADAIRRFDLDAPRSGTSVVEEIFQLQSAMDRMRTSLGVFGQYVPKALVQKLIQQNEIPHLGGTRRELTVLFMDMENFTAMSADLDPDDVMNRMSHYFEAVTQVLLAHGATIDKYIGDAVMAFWNAPEDTPDHAALACQAALAVKEAAAQVTNSWQDIEMPVRTRIGVHTGPATVGNVGSSDRMNYTAFGATVNLAARLEGLNRDLKTDILVSTQLAKVCAGRFEFQSAGHSRLKGFAEPVEVFTLTKNQDTMTGKVE